MYLFIVTLLVSIIFFFQIINIPKIVQGPRYLYHFVPLIVILASISFNSSKFIFAKIYLKRLFFILNFVLLTSSIILFYENYLLKIQKIDFESSLNKDEMFVAYNKIKDIKKVKSNPVVCASYYASIPSEFSNLILKDYQITNLKEVRNKECDYIALDSNATGRYIWFKESLDHLIIPKFEKISVINQKIGKENILRIQNMVENLIQNPKYGYKVLFYNKKMIFLKKN